MLPTTVVVPAYLSNSRCEPNIASDGAAGADLRANIAAPLRLAPGQSASVPTGLFIQLPPGYAAFVVPRSGLAAKYKVSVLNSPGLIDSDYRGEIVVLLENRGSASFALEPEERFAQLLVLQVPPVAFSYVGTEEDLAPSQRGAQGFASTGRM